MNLFLPGICHICDMETIITCDQRYCLHCMANAYLNKKVDIDILKKFFFYHAQTDLKCYDNGVDYGSRVQNAHDYCIQHSVFHSGMNYVKPVGWNVNMVYYERNGDLCQDHVRQLLRTVKNSSSSVSLPLLEELKLQRYEIYKTSHTSFSNNPKVGRNKSVDNKFMVYYPQSRILFQYQKKGNEAWYFCFEPIQKLFKIEFDISRETLLSTFTNVNTSIELLNEHGIVRFPTIGSVSFVNVLQSQVFDVGYFHNCRYVHFIDMQILHTYFTHLEREKLFYLSFIHGSMNRIYYNDVVYEIKKFLDFSQEKKKISL